MTQILLLILAVLLCAFFSGSETAFVSTTLYETEIWLKRRRLGATAAHRFVQHPETLLVTILVGNNVAIVAFSSTITYYLQNYVNDFLILLMNSAIILIFAEILPKTILREKSHQTVRFLAIPMVVFYILMYPIIWTVNLFSKILLSLLQTDPQKMDQFFSRRDIEILIREGTGNGLVEESEQKIITRLFHLSELKVREIMVPRTEIVYLRISDSISEVTRKIEEFRFSRYPVIRKRLDDVAGAVFAKDLLKKPATLQEILRPVLFVPESKLCLDMLREFRQRKMSLAIVVDEYGGTSGLITLEDIVEELFGEIRDEYDRELPFFKRVAKDTVIASGRAEIHDLNRDLGWHLPEGNYETVGGLIIEREGRIPAPGEMVRVNGFRIQIVKASPKKIQVVKIQLVEAS